MVTLTASVDGLEQLNGAIARWQESMADLTPFWREVFVPAVLQDIQDNWDQQGAMVGGWAAVSPAYAAWKAQRWGSHLGILELSLRLRGSLQWLGSDIGPEGILRMSRDGVEIGTSVPYAKKHQDGAGIARRQFLFLRTADVYEPMWTEWLRERGRQAGLPVP